MNMHSNRPSFWATAGIVAKREVVTRFLSKSFIISTLLTLGLMLALVIVGPQLSRWMQGSTTIAASSEFAPALAALPNVEVTTVADDNAAIELVTDETVKAAVVTDTTSPLGYKLVALEQEPDRLITMLSVSPQVEILQPSDNNMGVVLTLSLGFGIVWMMAAITYGMSIAQSVVEEKQTRIVEILLASITSKALLTGKILGSSAAALTQVLAIAVTALIGIALNGSDLPISGLSIPITWFVVLFVFGFLMVAAMYAAAAALVSRSEDLNNVLQPFVWVVMLPYMGIVMAASNPTALAVMSYIPISAPVAVPVRVFMGQGAAWEPFLSLVILVVSTAAIVWLAAKIYDRGLLRTGAQMKWKEALKAEA